ncbi:hypothetical protein GCM10011515_21340 [Tsuneonella deserti]|uniref:DUF192 domain-containing protein n=1 Tax=Tsuneonella deserti TaxID=2035528 RepID=A0ABQ1SBD2_9SPHN|nr:DUF192 domain-containing protein [Tsuneonella deserti]GGE01304.1 hypothetical protein GCM10011515_21340 [Tsuneonella deserti]
MTHLRPAMTFLALAALGAFSACSPQPAAEATPTAAAVSQRHPVSGLPVIPLSVATPKGKHTFRVEVARSSEEQARGLMFRNELGADEGMIFPREPADLASFWMKNTPLPLDIIFIGADRRILNIAANTVPYSLTPVSAAGLTTAVLEIPGGRAAQLGIVPGARVDW